jgi:hypothetical protein
MDMKTPILGALVGTAVAMGSLPAVAGSLGAGVAPLAALETAASLVVPVQGPPPPPPPRAAPPPAPGPGAPPPPRRRGPDPGVALGIGAAVGIIGGMIAAEEARRQEAEAIRQEDIEYCMARFRTYNPETGLYVGRDGRRHPCP